MSTETFAYPFDPTGTLASNKIVGERQAISAPQHTRFYVIIPEAGPFFRTGHKLIHHPSGRTLVEGVDYALTHRFHDASLACGKPIYGSYTLNDHSMGGVIELEYQSLGGPWTLSDAKIIEILENNLTNPRTTTWEMIADPPHEFPVVDHPWELTDLVGASAVVEKLNAIEDAIRDSAAGANDLHVNDYNNPHQTTKAQVGLGNVANLPLASSLEATTGTAHDRYMTPLRTREAILNVVGTAFTAHAADRNNPHQTTKAHVGLSNVSNFGTATPAQAVEGLAADLFMTPVATAAVIQDLLADVITPHINRLDNPHQTNKGHVGLGSVENFPPASTEQALAATSNAHYMTPVRTRELVTALFGDTLINHVNDRTNPHGVDKSQIGLSNVPNLGLATTQAAQAGQDDSGLMTPRLVHEAILALGGGGGGSGSGIDSLHRSDFENPHQTTAEQVGAYDKATTDAKLAQKLSMTGTAANASRLEGRNLNDVLRLARARFDWPAVVPSVINGNPVNDGVTWTALGTFIPQGPIDNDHPVADMVFEFTGGDRRQANAIPIYKVKLNIFPTPKLEVEQTAGVVTETRFGYVRDVATQAITVYVKSAPQRNHMSVLVLSDPTGGLGLTQAPLDDEPFGIVYEDSFVYMGGAPNVDAYPGDVLYGRNPHHENLPDFTPSLEFVNVVASGDTNAVLAARQTFNSMRDDYHDFIPASAWADKSRHAVKADLLGWTWKNALSSTVHVPESTSLTTLLSPNAYDNYSFEVELNSADAQGGAIGVCAAFIRKNGKDYGIFALRHPGGLAADAAAGNLPGGTFYKRFSVGINLLQDDAVDLGSADFDVPAGDTWPVAGSCRMKVTRNGNVIYIQTTPFGSSDFTAGMTVTVNLNDLPELAVFKAPTLWGLTKYKQTNTAFRMFARPDATPPYVSLANDADGNDISLINRFNGQYWVAQPMSLDNSFAKPNRLYYSEINRRMFYTRRDGTLRLLGFEAYTDQNITVLTE